MPRLHASFRYRDARAAIDWLERAFGFERVSVHEGDDGTIGHAELRLGDDIIMLGTEAAEPDPRWGARTGTQWIYVAVENADAAFERATAAGAEVVMPLTDLEYGSRDFAVRDPEGNLWSFGTYSP
jgi:uncharacterized glyoxalase superfamily protein PhnB